MGAEPWSEAFRLLIEKRWALRAFDSYGLSEMLGPGVAFECEARDGLHVMEDHFLPEVVDPESGRVLPEGSEGELVLTSLTKEAMPLLRYRTGDRTALSFRPCPCGRTLARIQRVRGRTDDMLIVRGVNLFPSEVERVLLRAEGLLPHYNLVLERAGSMDRITIRVEAKPELSAREGLARQVQKDLKAELGLTATVEILPPGALGRSEGTKALRVIDRRVP